MSGSLDRRGFIQTVGASSLLLTNIDWLRPPISVEIPPVQVHLLDPATMDVDDAASRFVRNEAEKFQNVVTQAARSAGVTPEVIGISDPIGHILGKSYRKVQIVGGVPMDAFPGSPLAPVLIDAVVEKGRDATLVFFGDDANLYPVRKVLTENKNNAPLIRYDLGQKTVVEGQVQKKELNGVLRDVFSLIAVNGDIVPENELQEAAKLFGTTVFAPGSAMEKAFKKWSLTPWITKFTNNARLEAEVEKLPTRKIFSLGTVQNWLNSGTAEPITAPLAVLDGKRTIQLNSENDVEITNALAAVEQKLKAQAGLSEISLVLYQREDSPMGSTQPNIVSVDSTNVMPREEPQQASVLVDLVPTVDDKTNDVVWYDKDGKPMFVTLFKKPGILYRVVDFKTEQQVNKVTDMKPVVGIDTVPMISLVPSEVAIKNFAPKTFAETVQGKIPDRLLQDSLSEATKITSLQEALRKLGITSPEPPMRIWQNSRLSLGAPAFGFIASVFNVLGLGEKIVTLPKDLFPTAETPITAKIIFVCPVNNPDKPFPVVAGYTYSHSKQKVVVGSPDIYQQVGNRFAPDKTHKVGDLRQYELDLVVGMDEVTLANGKDVKIVPSGPNRDYFASVGQKLKDYFGILDMDEAIKILQPGGPGTPENKQALLEEAMKRPIKLAWSVSYKA